MSLLCLFETKQLGERKYAQKCVLCGFEMETVTERLFKECEVASTMTAEEYEAVAKRKLTTTEKAEHQPRRAGPGEVGSHLREVFKESGAESCMGCRNLEQEMNMVGSAVVRAAISIYADKVRANSKDFPWTERLKVGTMAALAGYTSIESMIEEACRRAEVSQ